MEATAISHGRYAGAVAAGHPMTVNAARDILKAGGNAFDAALGAMCMATVAEPVLASFGGGGFLLARPVNSPAKLFDFFAQTPKRGPVPGARDFYPVVADFGPAQQEFHIGLGSMAVPGVVDGLFHVHDALGHMPLERLIEPALEAARDGYEVSPFQAYLFSVVGPIYMISDAARCIFACPGDPGRLIGEGDHFRNLDAADFLDALVREGPRLFYEGEIANRIAEDCRDGLGTLSREDLASYRTVEREPLAVDVADTQVFTNPLPSTGGVLVAFALKLLEGTMGLDGTWGTADHALALLRAMAVTEEARNRTALSQLLGCENLSAYRQALASHPQARRGTTHISIIDGDDNACALTLSNGEGAGYVIPGTGVMMNNMLGEEDINPQGLDSWPLDVRMGSMMAPTIIEQPGRLMVLGSGGSNRIRTAILQVILNLTAFSMTVEEAVSAPRFHLEQGCLDVEPGWPERAVQALRAEIPDTRIWPDRNLFFGGVHAVTAGPDLQQAAGDPRRAGAAAIIGR